MVWGRGTYLNLPGAVGITLNALLIFVCLTMAWYHARGRRFVLHRRWALRTFVVASAVWFMRVGYMAWGIVTGGAGIGETMNGPFDMFIVFGNSFSFADDRLEGRNAQLFHRQRVDVAPPFHPRATAPSSAVYVRRPTRDWTTMIAIRSRRISTSCHKRMSRSSSRVTLRPPMGFAGRRWVPSVV